MNASELANPHVTAQPTYNAGKPIADIVREFGIDPSQIIRLGSNENPFGPSPMGVQAAQRAVLEGHLYPDGNCLSLRQKLADKYRLSVDEIVIGNGSNEIIELLGHAFLGRGDEVVMGTPAFAAYKLTTLLFNARPVEVPLVNHTHNLSDLLSAVTARTKLIFLPCPNNPTGTTNTQEQLFKFVRALPAHTVFVLDEAYAEFVENPPDLRPLIREGRKLICLRTFSKIYGLASLRVGYGYGNLDLIGLLNRVRQPFNVNGIGQAAALAALDDHAFTKRCAHETKTGMLELEKGLRLLGYEYVPSVANFVLIRIHENKDVFQALQQFGIVTYHMRAYGMPNWLRLSVGTSAQIGRTLNILAKI